MSVPVELKHGFSLNIEYAKTPAIMMASEYVLGGLAIEFISADGIREPLARASVWIGGITRTLKFNQFVCKSYAENEGMLEFFLKSGFAKIAEGVAPVSTGFVTCRVLELSPELSDVLRLNLKRSVRSSED